MFVCKYSLLLFLIFCQFNVIKSMNSDEENTEIFDDLDDIVTDYKGKKPIYRPSYYKYSSDLHLEREIKKAVSNILEEKWLKIKNNSGPLKPSPSVSNFKKPRNLFFDKTNFQMIKLEDILPNYYKEKAVKQLKTTGKRSERKRKNFKNLELDEFPKIKFDNGESSNSKLNEKNEDANKQVHVDNKNNNETNNTEKKVYNFDLNLPVEEAIVQISSSEDNV